VPDTVLQFSAVADDRLLAAAGSVLVGVDLWAGDVAWVRQLAFPVGGLRAGAGHVFPKISDGVWTISTKTGEAKHFGLGNADAPASILGAARGVVLCSTTSESVTLLDLDTGAARRCPVPRHYADDSVDAGPDVLLVEPERIRVLAWA
jgi:hypothetical protein